MKNLRRLVTTLLAIAFPLAGCGETKHIHTWDNKWSFNENQHWVVATCHPEVCDLLEDHIDTDTDGYCDTCGYKFSSEPIIPEEKKEFTNLVFSSQEFEYDGSSHSLSVSNLPEGANVQYENNDKVEIGVYTVKATVSKDGYNTKVLTATLTIKEHVEKQNFEGVTLESNSFTYDGKNHSLAVSGAPVDANIKYTNNSQKNVGVYKVTATVTKNGYNDLTLEATLTIVAADFTNLKFESKSFEYDGNAHSLVVENVPTGATVNYVNNNKTAVGTYTVKATVTKTGYNTKELTATLEITPAKDPIEVDTTKTAFTLNNSTTFDDFKEAIFGGNFTLEYESGSRFLYYSGASDPGVYTRTETRVSSFGVFGADNDKTYKKVSQVWEDPTTTETIYTKVVGDYAFSKHVYTDGTSENFTKIPSFAFNETFLYEYPVEIFNHIRRTDSNGFESFIYMNYYSYLAKFEFTDNTFVLDIYTHIDHSDISRVTQEYTKLIFSNIGNTIVNIPSQYIGLEKDVSKYDVGEFVFDGLSYSSSSNEVEANITLDYGEVAYLPKGHLQLLPDVFGVPVKTIDMDFYTADRGHHAADCTGYILDTQFDENYKYCLKYKEYGYLNPTDVYHWTPAFYFGRFEGFGGEINYHGPDVVDVGFFQDRTSGSVQDLDKYNVSVINADYYTDAQIKKIQATGTKVFGFLNVGLISKSASYYNDFKDIMLKDYELDSNYSWIDVSESSWKNYVRDTLITGLYNKGLDGIYLAGTRVYEQYLTGKYDARQGISKMMSKVNYFEIELMMDFCDSMMEDFKGDGNDAYAPYYVDYYIQEEVFTKVTDRATNEFTAQSSDVETDLKNKIINQNNLYNFNVVLLEYEVDKATNDKIESYCAEMGYHCYIANKVIMY